MMNEDPNVFLAESEFATAGTFGAVTALGILDRQYAESLEVAGYTPVFHVPQATADQIPIDTVGTIDGQAYAVRNVEPDGTGFAVLILEEV
jgi:hypothetical protein